MDEFRNYDQLFPELVYDILHYFWINNRVKKPNEKSVLNYCETSRFNTELPKGDIIQPDVVNLICQKMVKNGVLVKTGNGLGMPDLTSNYLYVPKDNTLFDTMDPSILFRFNCMAYGFRYIYGAYRQYVMPIIVRKKGKITMGTCFKFRNGILTAKHCVEADEVAIPGYTSEKLQKCKVVVSEDEKLDMAYIETNEPSVLLPSEAKVLDEVLVMGYPKIPQFFDFCAAERAAISSIPTRGAVASLSGQFINYRVGELMLVTARIRGGNSGGPIISTEGAVVGVAFCEPMSEGDYDEMGYGIAYPIAVFNQMLQYATFLNVNFVDNIES